jgi:hypothetical protein
MVKFVQDRLVHFYTQLLYKLLLAFALPDLLQKIINQLVITFCNISRSAKTNES